MIEKNTSRLEGTPPVPGGEKESGAVALNSYCCPVTTAPGKPAARGLSFIAITSLSLSQLAQSNTGSSRPCTVVMMCNKLASPKNQQR